MGRRLTERRKTFAWSRSHTDLISGIMKQLFEKQMKFHPYFEIAEQNFRKEKNWVSNNNCF